MNIVHEENNPLAVAGFAGCSIAVSFMQLLLVCLVVRLGNLG